MTIASGTNGTGQLRIFCGGCGTTIDAHVKFCPHCGLHRLDLPTTAAVDQVITAPLPPLPVPDSVPAEWARAESEAALVGGVWQPTADRPRRSRWRDWRVIAAAIVALAVVATSAWFGYSWLRDRSAHEQLSVGNDVTAELLTDMGAANDLSAIAGLADAAVAAESELDSAISVLRTEDTELGRAALAVALAEREAVAAAVALAGIDAPGLPGWADASAGLEQAASNLATAAAALNTIDSSASGEVPNLADGVGHLQQVVADTVEADAARSVDKLLSDLTSAETTERVRKLAGSAAAEAKTVDAALAGLAGSAGQDLQPYPPVFAALAALTALDADTLRTWGTMRAPLAQALAGLETSGGQAALTSLDGLVKRGEAQIAKWRKANQAALAAVESDRAVLDEYASKMETQVLRYSDLRSSLSDWIDHVEAPGSYVTYSDAYTELYDAESSRQAVLDAMTGLRVPGPLQGEHAGVTSVIQDAIYAVRSAYSGLSDADSCVNSCYYAYTPGWQHFSSESGRITSAYNSALTNWRNALAQARQEIRDRPLPPMPEV